MALRSVTRIHDEYGDHLVSIYQQYNGDPSGVGNELARFLADVQVVNGIPCGKDEAKASRLANGGGCLAAQLIAYLKQDVGGVYITTLDDSQEFNYEIYAVVGEPIRMVCKSDGTVLFDGLAKDFDGCKLEA